MEQAYIIASSSSSVPASPLETNAPFILQTSPGNELAAVEHFATSNQKSGSAQASISLSWSGAVASLLSTQSKTSAFALGTGFLSALSNQSGSLIADYSQVSVFSVFMNWVTVANPIMNLVAGLQQFLSGRQALFVDHTLARALVAESLASSFLDTNCAYAIERLFAETKPSLESIYQVDDLDAVNQFVTTNRFLEPLLFEAREKIAEVFGPEFQVRLELSINPDPESDPKLYAFVLTPLDVEETIALREKFYESWWFANLSRAQWKFNIGTEYV